MQNVSAGLRKQWDFRACARVRDRARVCPRLGFRAAHSDEPTPCERIVSGCCYYRHH